MESLVTARCCIINRERWGGVAVAQAGRVAVGRRSDGSRAREEGQRIKSSTSMGSWDSWGGGRRLGRVVGALKLEGCLLPSSKSGSGSSRNVTVTARRQKVRNCESTVKGKHKDRSQRTPSQRSKVLAAGSHRIDYCSRRKGLTKASGSPW